MFNKLFEFLFGFDLGFVARSGELHARFDPHWPGPLMGEAGQWTNYLLGITAIALFVLISRRTSNKALHRLRIGVAAGAAVVVAFLIPMTVKFQAWNIALLIAVLAATTWLFWKRRENGILVLGRFALFGLLLLTLSGTLAWNLVLGAAGLLLVIYVYRREGRSPRARTFLGILRTGLIALVLLLLNNPILSRIHTIVEPSVVAVLVDDSLSMSIRDVNPSDASSGESRFEASVGLFSNEQQAMIRKLAKVHTLQFYTFNQAATPVGKVPGPDEAVKQEDHPTEAPAQLAQQLINMKPTGVSTQVVPSILTVLNALQGQRLAGVVIVTDGRDTPTSPLAEAYKRLSAFGVKVYSVAVGSDKAPKNITVQDVNVQDSAFMGDLVNVRTTIRAAGYEPGHKVTLRLLDANTGLPLKGLNGEIVQKEISVNDSNPIPEELLFKPDQIGTLKVKVEAIRQPGESDEEDNVRTREVAVLDAKITVLYVEGYPRWEYRYIKNEMIRDRTVNISCVLTSADPTFAQEHTDLASRHEASKYKYFPFNQFPNTMEQLMECDVVLFGDVDPRQFADSQLQLLSDFVNKKGGGFGMIAGPQASPGAYRNTPLEAILPVTVVNPPPAGWPTEPITEGFRPILTKDGAASSMFRFIPDKAKNDAYVKDKLQLLYWYSRGVIAKPGSEVYAEHPFDLGPDGRKAPLLVLGRFGAGRTLFTAYDESWRWRFYTGESVFDTYWIQQLRYLARSKKLGQKAVIYSPDRNVYELGEQVHLSLRVMDVEILKQLPPRIEVQVKDKKTGQVVKTVTLQNSPSQPDEYTASFGADRVGQYTLAVRDDTINNAAHLDETIEVIIPKLELAEPQVDRTLLSHVASETGGVALNLAEARAKLPDLIQSAARTLAPSDDHALWDKPIVLLLFVLLLTSEWVLRKVFGMV